MCCGTSASWAEGALNPEGFQGERCLGGAASALAVPGVCRAGLGDAGVQIPPSSDTPCVQYIVFLLYISQGDDESQQFSQNCSFSE